tara:strand:+ start:1140 stop:1841 length:702 start_codon:yes stop_codon:yes gene_type:complete
MKKYILTIIFILSFGTSAALAGQGFGVGLVVNTSTFDTVGGEFEGGLAGEYEETTVSEDVQFPGIFAEFTTPDFGIFSITTGFEWTPGEAELGAKSRTDTTTDGNEDDQDDNTYTAKAEVSDHWAFYIEPTVALNENVGLFVKAGVSTLTVNSLEDISSGTDSSAYGNETINGASYGVGINATLPELGGAYLKLAYEYTGYEPVTLTSTTGNSNVIEADTEQEAIRLSIGYKF